MLEKNTVLQTLKKNREDLKKFGVKKLALFGSMARGDQKASSDLDFVVEFYQKSFDSYMGLKEYLETLFGCKVDLVLPETIKNRLRSSILSELIDAA